MPLHQHQIKILEVKKYLSENLKVKNTPIIDRLVDSGVLSDAERNVLKKRNDNEDQVIGLCDLLYRKPKKDWDRFLRVLQENNLQHILEGLKKKVTEPYEQRLHFLGEVTSVSKEDDALSYNFFAEGIAELLTDEHTDSPMSIGIFGKWGSGKSVILDLIEDELTSQAKLEGTHGWVQERNTNGGWEWFWCIIRNNQLHFSKKKYSDEISHAVMLEDKMAKSEGNRILIFAKNQTVENRPEYVFATPSEEETELWAHAIQQAITDAQTSDQVVNPGQFMTKRGSDWVSCSCEIHGDTLYYQVGGKWATLFLPRTKVVQRRFTDNNMARCGFEILRAEEDLGKMFCPEDRSDPNVWIQAIKRIIKEGDKDRGKTNAGLAFNQGDSGRYGWAITLLLLIFTITMWSIYHISCKCGQMESEKEKINATTSALEGVQQTRCCALQILSSILSVILFICFIILIQQIYTDGSFSALKFIYRTCCYITKAPVRDGGLQKRRHRSLIPVRFNSWEYAGCSKLWAGIVVKLCDVVEKRFGKWTVLYFRIMSNVLGQMEHSTRISRICTVISQVMLILALIIPLIYSIVYFGISKTCNLVDLSTPLGLAIPMVLAFAKILFQVYKFGVPYSNFVKALTHKMAKPNFEEELGYMHAVKKEVLLINKLFRYMSMLEKRNYIPVLFVDDLDRSDHTKVKTMTEALHILFNDPQINFYSVVAVDQHVLCYALNKEFSNEEISKWTSMSPMRYFKKIIHLPICLPPGNIDTTQKLLKMANPNASYTETAYSNREAYPEVIAADQPRDQGNELEAGRDRNDTNTIQPESTAVDYVGTYDRFMGKLINGPDFIQTNPRHLKRLSNICNIACRLIYKKEPTFTDINFVLVLVIAEQWPVRTSALLHLAYKANIGLYSENNDCLMSEYITHVNKLLALPQLNPFLVNFDESPHEFSVFLEKHQLTFEHLLKSKPFIINLPGYIQELIAAAEAAHDVQQNQNTNRSISTQWSDLDHFESMPGSIYS